MKNLGPTMRKAIIVSLVVVMFTVTFGVSLASADSGQGKGVPDKGTPAKSMWDKDMLDKMVGFTLCKYTVRRGDTMFGISRKFGMPIWVVSNLNHITNVNLVRSGSTLFVPCRVPTKSEPKGKLEPKHDDKPFVGCSYRVQRGQTLFGIADRFDTSVGFLAAVNHIANPSKIFAGQWLRVPCDKD